MIATWSVKFVSPQAMTTHHFFVETLPRILMYCTSALNFCIRLVNLFFLTSSAKTVDLIYFEATKMYKSMCCNEIILPGKRSKFKIFL